jgi:hypothetical protein
MHPATAWAGNPFISLDQRPSFRFHTLAVQVVRKIRYRISSGLPSQGLLLHLAPRTGTAFGLPAHLLYLLTPIHA